jgi:uncharacterized delta-60 repeat protein
MPARSDWQIGTKRLRGGQMKRTLAIALFSSALLIIASAFTLGAQGYLQASGYPSNPVTAGDELDPSFGVGGKVITDFFGNNDQVNGIAIQGDGKIVAVGSALRDATTPGLGIARYNPDGTLDTNFGTGGKVTADVPGILDRFVPIAVALQSNGKIVVGGESANLSTGFSQFALARFNANGSLDVSFGDEGRVITNMSNFGDSALALAIQPDGKILAVGEVNDVYYASITPYCAMVRYNTDGSLDSTFGSAGIVRASPGKLHAVVIQPDEKIVAAGISVAGHYAPSRLAVWRYNSNGTYDGSFGNGGLFPGFDGIYIIGADPALKFYAARSILLLPGGELIAAGLAGDGTTNYFGLIKLNSAGNLDPSFDADGIVTTDFRPRSAGSTAVGLQADGKIVAAGYARGIDEVGDFAVVRYNPDGSSDVSFGDNGKVTTSFGGFSSAQSLAVQPNGNIVVAGYGTGDVSRDFALARYGDYVTFNLSVQDENNDYMLMLNSVTGEYKAFSCAGFMVYGTGSMVQKGGNITLQHTAADRRVLVKIDTYQHKATASIQLLSTGQSINIIDRSTLNNRCTCPR